ncbi:MAG: DUF5906 domain-containing protein [Oscillospiraceae bacterium]
MKVEMTPEEIGKALEKAVSESNMKITNEQADKIIEKYEKGSEIKNTLRVKGRTIKVGTRFYKCVNDVDDNTLIWVESDRPSLKDEGIDPSDVERFNGWTVNYNFIAHKEIVNNWVNQVTPLSYAPAQGKWEHIEILLRHVFGEQYALGLDYYRILVKHPKQLLPIIALVSEERQTGKTTLLNLNAMIFESAVANISIHDYAADHNECWAQKLLIQLDETKVSSFTLLESIKRDSTRSDIQLRGMYKSRQTVPFCGKFILTSNQPDNFMRIDEEEIRYWVRYVPKFNTYIDNFQDKLKHEVPAFLHFLINTEIEYASKGRAWFHEEDYRTVWLDELKANSISDLAASIKEVVENTFIETGCERYSAKDIFLLLGNKYDLHKISKCLKKELKLNYQHCRYTPFYGGASKAGRVYVFNFDDIEIDSNG